MVQHLFSSLSVVASLPFLSLLPTASGRLVFDFNNTRVQMPCYSLNFYTATFNESSVAMVDLQADETIFNWCDLDSYTPEGVKDILEYHHIYEADLQRGLKWVAFFTVEMFCEGFDFRNIMETYILSYEYPSAAFIQSTGAIGMLGSMLVSMPRLYIYYTISGVDRKTGLVSNSLFFGGTTKPEYVGRKIDIWGATIDGEARDELLRSALEDYRANNLTLMISSISNDRDEWNEMYFKPVSFFYYYHRITIALCCSMCLAAILYAVVVIRYHWTSSVKFVSYSGASLVAALLSNICRFPAFLDPYTILGMTTFEYYIVGSSLGTSLHILASICSLLYWIDFLLMIDAAMNYRIKKTFLSKSKYVLVSMLIGFAIWALLDAYMSYAVDVITDPLQYFTGDGIISFGSDPEKGYYNYYFARSMAGYLVGIIQIGLALSIKNSGDRLQTIHAVASIASGQQLTLKDEQDPSVSKNTSPSKIKPAPASKPSEEKTKPTGPAKIATSSPVVVVRTFQPAVGSKTASAKAEEFSKGQHLSKRMMKQSVAVFRSGVCMLIASTLILTMQADTEAWDNCLNNEYYFNSAYLLPYLFTQISSIYEVRIVDIMVRTNRQKI